MSIGPNLKNEVEEVPVFKRFSASAQKTVTQYFAKPAHYLFYTLLTLGAGALLINQEPPLKFWILIGVVGVLNVGRAVFGELIPPEVKKTTNAKQRSR